MDARLEKIENSEAYIGIEVDPERMEEGMQVAYRKVVKEVAIPGFRKGRVPRELLEAQFGREILFQDALEYVVPRAYEEAVKDLDIEAIAPPEFDFDDEIKIEEGKVFKFIARAPLKPEVKLGKMEGLQVTVPSAEVSEEDIESKIEEMRLRYAQLEEKTEETAEMGDTVTLDFEGFVDGKPFAGGKGENHALELGSNTFIPGFEEQLVGLKAGDSQDVNVTFPEGYHADDLAGKDAVFKVDINKIECKKIRELNDEFVQEVSQFDTVEELREDTRKSLAEIAEYRRNEVLRYEILDKAMQECEISVPDAVVRAQVQNMMQDFEQRIVAQGLSMEQYFQFTSSNQDELAQRMWPEGERLAKSNFMLEKLIEEKGFEVSDEEIDKRIEGIAQDMGMDLEMARENFADLMDQLEFGIKMDKAVDYLTDNAVISNEEKKAEEQAEEQLAE
jgi:trigger factor